MRVHQLWDETLRFLSEVEADEPVVVSAFLALDPAEFATPPARESRVNSLLNEFDALVREADLSDDARAELSADRQRIEAFLRDDLDVSRAEVIAIYSAQALDFFLALKLADPVESSVRIELRPILEPMIGHEDEGDCS